jgi:hypothetical protein
MIFKKDKPTFEHASIVQNDFPTVKQASATVPDWYKKTPKFLSGKFSEVDDRTFKACTPFLEAITTGYHLLLPADIMVSIKNGKQAFFWRNRDQLVDQRNPQSNPSLPVPHGYSNEHWVWKTFGSFTVPKDYSILFTHPLNRNDLPFYTLSGVLEGGYVLAPHGSIPFFLKENFEGVIHQGTPIAQLIPFKNEKWELKENNKILEEGFKNTEKANTVFLGWYKNTHWKKKQW